MAHNWYIQLSKEEKIRKENGQEQIPKTTDTENKRQDITDLATKAALSGKAAEVEGKLTDVNNLTTKTALNKNATDIENKTHDITNIARKAILAIQKF